MTRLIDADALIAKIAETTTFIMDSVLFQKMVDEAPTVSAEPNKAVPLSLADVYKWERDIALSQLEEYGIGFGEKKRDDLVSVVRCKDCRYRELDGEVAHFYWCRINDRSVDDGDFCAWGEESEVEE